MVVISREIYDSSQGLKHTAKKLYDLAVKKANTEQAYRKALAVEIMRLKSEKIPATLIPDIARGNTAELKFERDLAETVWKGAIDYLRALEAQLSGLQSILKHQSEV